MSCVVSLNFNNFAKRVVSAKQYDPAKANIIKKPEESKTDYLHRQQDIELLSFLMKAETPDEIKKGQPLLKKDGSIYGYRKVQPEDIARLFRELPTLLSEVGKDTILDRDLFSAVKNFKERSLEEEFYLF